MRSEAALAKICGVCPIPASSGKTNRMRQPAGKCRALSRCHRAHARSRTDENRYSQKDSGRQNAARHYTLRQAIHIW
ncbi:MAG: hypothetical protein ACK4GC_09185 [Paracoccaceae bacterium]